MHPDAPELAHRAAPPERPAGGPGADIPQVPRNFDP